MNHMRSWIKFLSTSCVGLLCALAFGQAAAVSGAVFTTTDPAVDGTGHCQNGNEAVNCNIYDAKTAVWLNGGPTAGQIGAGTYFFAVLVPGGQPNPNDAAVVPDDGSGTPKNLSDDFDAYNNRTFTITNGNVSYGGTHTFDSANNKIRLMPYSNTTNNGGVYIMAVCSLANLDPAKYGSPGVNPSTCKYDAFKVQESGSGDLPPGLPLTVSKDANGSYDDTFTWGIAKSVDKTIVKQIGGSATFTYTVTVTPDGGTISNVKVTGTITVFNPNLDGSNTVPVDIDGVSDQLSDGTVCTVTDGGPQTLTEAQTDFDYTCSLSSLPSGALSNTVTVSWSEQILDNASDLAAGSNDFTFDNIVFAESAIDDCVTVTDPNAPSNPLGTACVGGTKFSFQYKLTVPVPQFGCKSYNNTATFTTDTTGTTGTASQSVTVCGPANTGALTMGFWQNKNGQAIITGGAAVSGVCKSGTWLRTFLPGPYQDLSATASCSQVGTYVTNVIKAATCSGPASAPCNAMLKGQDLATSLDVYFSDPSLGGVKIAAPSGPIGAVSIDLTMICKMIDASGGTATCSGTFENVGPAFGGATSMTVLQMLTYAASQAGANGTPWYGTNKVLQVLAKDAFDAINNDVAFAP